MKRFSIGFTALVLVFATTLAARADNLVVNGDFETTDFTGWTQTGNTDSSVVFVGCLGSGSYLSGNSLFAHSGSCAANFGPPEDDPGGTSQELTTVAGQSYTVSFWLANNGGFQVIPNDFSALWNGDSRVSFTDSDNFDWTQYSFDVVGTGADDLSFSFRQDPGFIGLDDVSVSAPEPSTLPLLGFGLAGIVVVYRRHLIAVSEVEQR